MSILIKNVCFSYETQCILHKVNALIEQGEFIGIMGPNGGGKTTFLKLLLKLLKPDQGTITVQGKLGYVPQVPQLDRDFPITLEEFVLLGGLSQVSWLGIYPPEVKRKATYWIDKLGLKPHKQKALGVLSGGLAQRALLARALVSDPDILLLDEPTAHIDAYSCQILFDVLESLKGKKTILLVTHDLKTIIERVDRLLCIQQQVSSYLPKEVCEHFALGLYHTPLLELPPNHFPKQKEEKPLAF